MGSFFISFVFLHCSNEGGFAWCRVGFLEGTVSCYVSLATAIEACSCLHMFLLFFFRVCPLYHVYIHRDYSRISVALGDPNFRSWGIKRVSSWLGKRSPRKGSVWYAPLCPSAWPRCPSCFNCFTLLPYLMLILCCCYPSVPAIGSFVFDTVDH